MELIVTHCVSAEGAVEPCPGGRNNHYRIDPNARGPTPACVCTYEYAEFSVRTSNV